jgi:hypothetical protein
MNIPTGWPRVADSALAYGEGVVMLAAAKRLRNPP